MKNPAGALTKTVAALKPTTTIADSPGIVTHDASVDRRLPPPELNARRTRKRNQPHLPKAA